VPDREVSADVCLTGQTTGRKQFLMIIGGRECTDSRNEMHDKIKLEKNEILVAADKLFKKNRI
jgi:hypothetical protein